LQLSALVLRWRLSVSGVRYADPQTSRRSYGKRFVVLEKAVGSAQYERLTLKHIRSLTAPGDKVLHRRPGSMLNSDCLTTWST